MSDLQEFLRQNDLVRDTITAEQAIALQVGDYATHHSGGLVVLGGYRTDGLYVKCHDSWGDDGQVVVHTYDPDWVWLEGQVDDPNEEEDYYTTGREAVAEFLRQVEGIE